MKNLIDGLLFPHKCVGCRQIFNIFSENFDPDEVYCKSCRAEWERSKILPCSECRLAGIECTCVPDVLKNLTVISVFKFGTVTASDRLVYSLKRKRLPRVYKFAADELAHRMVSYCRANSLDLSETVVTHVPRSRRSVAKFGFDHGSELAVMVAERLGLKVAALIKRRGRGKDQKKLSVDERFANSVNRFSLLNNADIKGKTVLIVDDVITTGATMSACASALRGGNPEKIMILCLAKSNKIKKK